MAMRGLPAELHLKSDVTLSVGAVHLHGKDIYAHSVSLLSLHDCLSEGTVGKLVQSLHLLERHQVSKNTWHSGVQDAFGKWLQ